MNRNNNNNNLYSTTTTTKKQQPVLDVGHVKGKAGRSKGAQVAKFTCERLPDHTNYRFSGFSHRFSWMFVKFKLIIHGILLKSHLIFLGF